MTLLLNFFSIEFLFVDVLHKLAFFRQRHCSPPPEASENELPFLPLKRFCVKFGKIREIFGSGFTKQNVKVLISPLASALDLDVLMDGLNYHCDVIEVL